jgi:ATP-dependent 26S proteasome regulatory subunit
MTSPVVGGWHSDNQRYLIEALRSVRGAVEQYMARESVMSFPSNEEMTKNAELMSASPAIERLTLNFGLSSFERNLLLLCAGVELDSSFATLCVEAQAGRISTPTFSLALAALAEPHWSALSPTAPLRYWKLIEVGPGASLVTSPLRIDERILHYLAGLSSLDERLHGVVMPCLSPGNLPATQQSVANRVVATWRNAKGGYPPIQLCGQEDAGLEEVAAVSCAQIGLGLYILRASSVPQRADDLETLLRLWTREWILTDSALLLTIDGDENIESLRAAASFVECAQVPLLVASRQPLPLRKRTSVRFDIHKPEPAEQSAFWHASLGPLGEQVNGQIEALVSQFNLGQLAITAISALVHEDQSPDVEQISAQLWETCRAQSRARLDDLAQRTETRATWNDLVLPAMQSQVLQDIVVHVRQREKVYTEWGFAARNHRGLGISALFAGPSGTGKTLAGEILANELHLDLYHIDLSQVVSKYIGETEKNLRRVFDAAEAGGAVLLFDEADALFGKRSEIKDSHDRYANIEVSYLLQRMEAYRGLAILTTNMKQALDAAFTRRIRFIVQFPFPDALQRAEIWSRIFPSDTPTKNLDIGRLARLNATGGNIRNIALGAAFLAADKGKPVGMEHLLRAARAEYAKIERPLTEAEIAGWI